MDTEYLNLEEIMEDSWSAGFIQGFRAARGYPEATNAILAEEIKGNLDIAKMLRHNKRKNRGKGKENV